MGGYTAPAEEDIQATLESVVAIDDRISRAIAAQGGSILNAFNSTFLASFPSAPAAFKAAIDIARSDYSDLRLSHIPLICGIHAGQVYSHGRHLFGSSIATTQWVSNQGNSQDRVILSETVAPLVQPHLPHGFTLRKDELRVRGLSNPVALFFLVSEEELAREHRLAFISYRRGRGSEIARLIASELERHNVEIFLDLDDLQPMHFDDQIYCKIESMPNFILILTPGCLDRCDEDGDWLRREISHALKLRRRMIPVMVDGFTFPGESDLASDISELPRHHGVKYTHEFANAAIEQIVAFLAKGPGQPCSPTPMT